MKSFFLDKVVKKIDDFMQCVGQILVYAFTIKYEFTSDLIGKMIWPFFLFLGILTFKSEIKDLATAITKKIPYAETLAITRDGVQISVINKNVINTASYSKELEIISNLNAEEIKFIVDFSEKTDDLKDSKEFQEIKPILDHLIELDLYKLESKDSKNDPFTESDISYMPTEKGDKVRQVINNITAECFVNGCVFDKE